MLKHIRSGHLRCKFCARTDRVSAPVGSDVAARISPRSPLQDPRARSELRGFYEDTDSCIGVPHFLATQCLRTKVTSVPEWDRQFRLVGVHHEHRKELGRLRLAGLGAGIWTP